MKRMISGLLLLCLVLSLLPCPFGQAAPADLGSLATNLPTGQQLFLTLYNGGSSPYRWNVSGLGEINSDVHIDDPTGSNCTFRLTTVETGWYGIKFVKENGTDRYIDVANKSTAEGKVLHIWESSDDKLAGNPHRQFAFYHAGTDSAGNPLYYIKLRHSNKWIGLKDNVVGAESKLIQTDLYPRKWYVTPCTVPFTGRESLPHTGSAGLYFEIFARNTMMSVSVKGREGNLETDGMGLNLYTIGQSSRWLLRYKASYKAYEIASTQYETKGGISLTGKVWDTASEAADTDLNVWSLQSKTENQNTSQLFRFEKNSDGSYYLYNARSGKYVCIKDSTLTQGERSSAQAFVLSFLSTDAASGYGNYFGGSSEELNWMKSIPDTVLLSEINLPATHDTGANAVIQDMNSALDNASVTKCQKHYYEEQLATGVRSFDVRTNASAENQSVHDVMIVHGGAYFQCYNRYGKELSLGEILDISKLFLQKHPSECITLLIKPDDGTHVDLERTLKAYIAQNPTLFWSSDKVPTLRQARGKIVLLRRYQLTSANATLGPDLTKWDDQDYSAVKGLVKLPQSSGAQVYIQDAYQQTGSNKIDYVQGAITDSASVPSNAYIYNYTSCTLGFVIDTTRQVNAWLYQQSLDGKRLGHVMMNYSDLMMARKIFRSNRFSQPALDSSVTILHSLDLASDISIHYVIPAAQLDLYDSFYLECTVPIYEGNTLIGSQKQRPEAVLRGSYYYFTLKGIAAIQMNDEIKARMYMEKDGISYCSAEDRYSVAAYALSQLSKSNAGEELRILCAELLRYGSSAQSYKQYRTDSPADSGLSPEQRLLLKELSSVEFAAPESWTSSDPELPLRWVGKALDLGSKVEFLFVFDPTGYDGSLEELHLQISYVNSYGESITTELSDCSLYEEGFDYYMFRFDGLTAAELRSPLGITIYQGEQPLSTTVEYSAASYGNGKTGPLLTVCQSLMAYSDAALAYFQSRI